MAKMEENWSNICQETCEASFFWSSIYALMSLSKGGFTSILFSAWLHDLHLIKMYARESSIALITAKMLAT